MMHYHKVVCPLTFYFNKKSKLESLYVSVMGPVVVFKQDGNYSAVTYR